MTQKCCLALQKVSWSQPAGIVGNQNPGCFINALSPEDLDQYQFPDPRPITFTVGSVAQIDFVGTETHTLLTECLPLLASFCKFLKLSRFFTGKSKRQIC